jgi:hypothetical protein
MSTNQMIDLMQQDEADGELFDDGKNFAVSGAAGSRRTKRQRYQRLLHGSELCVKIEREFGRHFDNKGTGSSDAHAAF